MIAGQTYVRIIGCDDSTEIPTSEFDAAQLVAIERLVKLSEEYSEYGCQPVVRVSRAIEKPTADRSRTYVGWDDD